LIKEFRSKNFDQRISTKEFTNKNFDHLVTLPSIKGFIDSSANPPRLSTDGQLQPVPWQVGVYRGHFQHDPKSGRKI
jgi:hypothetical protein